MNVFSARLVRYVPYEMQILNWENYRFITLEQIHFSLDGSAWKESLEDLSNEHRLLVALAVLLAVSVYATTPFLILAQIDAFLDEKQTSDLSVLIKEKYSNVQVICISPKRGEYCILLRATLLLMKSD